MYMYVDYIYNLKNISMNWLFFYVYSHVPSEFEGLYWAQQRKLKEQRLSDNRRMVGTLWNYCSLASRPAPYTFNTMRAFIARRCRITRVSRPRTAAQLTFVILKWCRELYTCTVASLPGLPRTRLTLSTPEISFKTSRNLCINA